ncbi:uncharacterized protein LOC126846223 [Adelges cooleyi]|uniref:uncharacterized protein LOC126846223 n=1 Tax=Adelges cooleyi TaxID=133065 RepID=UPI00217F58DB|nr:uncharacterized protein LOC126846223 [Adelges cooleyi]
MFVISVASALIKLCLHLYRRRLTFAKDSDYVKYEAVRIFVETVKITEHYCYVMAIRIVLRLDIPGKTVVVFLLRLLFNYWMKLTTKSCAYHVFHTNLIFVVYHSSPLLMTNVYDKVRRWSRDKLRCSVRMCDSDDNTNESSRQCQLIVEKNVLRGIEILKKVFILILASYLSNRIMLTLWTSNVMCTREVFLEARCNGHMKINSTFKAATTEAVITIVFLAVQLIFGNITKCFTAKYLVKTTIIMIINLIAFRCVGALMNPTYATAGMYGCQGMINRQHFIVYWIGPLVGAVVFGDIVKATQCLYKTVTSKLGITWKFPCPNEEKPANIVKTNDQVLLSENILNTYLFLEITNFKDIFERTLLKISLLESLYNTDDTVDTIKSFFQTTINNLSSFRSSITCHDLRWEPNDDSRGPIKHNENHNKNNEHTNTLEKKIKQLKRKELQVDAAIEKDTVQGEKNTIRRETEKLYVDKWEHSRIEHFKMKFTLDELELEKKISEARNKLKTETLVDKETKSFLDHSTTELKNQIEYWQSKSTLDVVRINERLDELTENLKTKTDQVWRLKMTFNERQTIIEESVEAKRKLEEEKRLDQHRERMAIKIQAWWRGTMVRRRLGQYKHLLGPRKKSIKKPAARGKKNKK